MAPSPTNSGEKIVSPTIQAGAWVAHPEPGEEVVITGLSGRFPDSDDVYEFRDKLFNKVDLVSDDGRRWKLDHPEIPQRTGKINHVTKFDAAFFGIHFKQAHTMDPMCRILLEKAYEAVVDAGYNPLHLKGSRCGVYIGSCFSESEKTWFYEKIQVNGFGITGCSRAMLANRISFWLGVNGPSYTIDSACSSSLYALEHAYKAIRDGICDSALVGGSNLCLHPYVSLQFSRLGVLSHDGACKSFDENANGYCRSEAIPMVFLQKKKDAKRIYATIVHAKTNCDGYKEQGITYPSGQVQYELLRDFYEECGVDPSTLNFIEAHGTGTKVGDPEECNALDKIFCTGRKEPLWIGSVKSNIGHSEPASGLCSVTKVIIAMESGFIPPNLHFKTPREGIPAFKEGRLKVVTEKQPWEGGLAGVNSFGFGGANCHALLKWNEKEKINGGAPRDSIPRLVVVSGRTEEACKVMLDDLESRPIDVEFVKLLHDIHSEEIPGHIYRGFTVLTNTDRKIRDIQYCPGQKRKIWFVFSGMGSNWPGMGRSLLKIPVFASAIEKCHNALQPKGVDLMKIITEEDPKIFDNIVYSFVGTAALQIGLVDVLKTIGINPDNIIGNSVGELGCAYADGCLTAEQTVLAAYYRGVASVETEFIKGSMVAVGLGYQKMKAIVPPEIDIACHNGPNACTLSGPQDAMKKFVAELTAQGVFVREVPCSNIPYHSRYMTKIGPRLLQYLQKVMPHPAPRSSKWLCSSIPEKKWTTPLARHSSAEYHTNSLLNPVLFEEACQHIPKDAITIEIAPHGLLQSILKRSLNKETTHVALMQRGHADNTQVLLTGIGKLYEAGVEVQLQNLYPHVPYPVSRGTPMISPLVKWEHSEDWYVTTYRLQEKIKSGERTISISLSDEDMEFLSGHVIDGRNLFPATGYLALVWETIGMMKGELYTELPIVFENVKFNRATTIPKEGAVDFIVMVQKSSGSFEVVEGGAPIVTGRAFVPDNIDMESSSLPMLKSDSSDLPLTPRDIYKELKLRGYHYSGLFRGLLSMDGTGSCGKISWANNYIAFMDNMLQTQILQEDTRSLYVPTSIQKLVIDTKKHMKIIREMKQEKEQSLHVSVYKDVNIIIAGGIEIRNLKASQIPRRKPLGDPVLEKYLFVPHILPPNKKQDLDLLETVRLCVHLALENVPGVKVKVTEVGDETVLPESVLLAPRVASILGDLPLIQAEIVVLSPSSNEKAKDLGPGITVEDKKMTADQTNLIVIGSNVLGRTELLQQSLGSLKPEGFLLVRENAKAQLPVEGFNVWVDRTVGGERIMLLKKKAPARIFDGRSEIVKISEKDGFNWLEPLKEHIKNAEVHTVLLVAEKEMTNGLMGLNNCLRQEPGGEKIRTIFVMDNNAPPFDINNPFYAEQLSKDLAVNVFKNGQWGSYRHQALPEPKMSDFEYIYINTSVRGDLSSFKFYESPLQVNQHHAEGPKTITVYYSSINFRDVMTASGKLSLDVIARGRLEQEIVIGFEFAGRYKETGKRVMGMISRGALTSVIGESAAGYLAWDIPDKWTLAEAATVPVVYGTVYTALITNGRMKKGDSILIHSGTGGVGLAAINVALFYGCTVFTTVGTPEKREYIRKMFPQIPDSHIGNSRDTSFEQMIKYETNGRGVDMVLNSLAEEKLQASVRCLADNGRFLEIGKFDLANNNPLGMEAFMRGISFHGVQLDAIFDASELRKRELTEIVEWALKSGAIKPLKTTIFDVSECEQAFRYMTTGKHMGKVLLRLRDEEPDDVVLPKPKLFAAEPRFFASDRKSYIIIGGLGGFGLELTDWLAIRGARKIVVTSRQGIRNGYQALRVRIWKSYGVQVVISTDDVTTEEGVTNLLKTANALGPVDGIFNLAVVLRDALFENQTEEDYRISFGGKAVATRHLDKVSRKLCPDLNYFVVFSSVSCGRGNAGQTNYGMANSIMERICESRHQEGLPGTAIQWGAIGDVGLVADMQEDHQELVIGGTLQQSISSCLQCLDVLLKQKHPIVASMVVAEKRAGGSGSGNIVDTVVNIMGIRDLKTVSLHSSLAELGMDSMMAVEIKQTLEREFEMFLTAQDIRGLTFAKLAEMDQKTEEQSSDDRAKTADATTGRLPDKSGQGLNLMLRLISEEYTAAESLISLDTKFGDAQTNLQSPTPANPPIFLIPGLEGMASVFTGFAKNLNLPALCLQYPYNNPANADMTKVAQYMYSTVKSRLPVEIPFLLAGHSTGGLVALELAFLLEAEGRTGKVFLLDGAPDLLKTLCAVTFGNCSDEEFDTTLLMAIYNLFVPGTNEKVKEDFNKFKTWDEKLQRLMAILPDSVPHSRKHQKITAFDLRQRLKAIIQYEKKDSKKLSAKTTLLRPTEQAIPDVLPEDYNLSKYVEQAVKVNFVEGNHLSMLDNKKTAQIINNAWNQLENPSMFKSQIMSVEGKATLLEKQKHRTH